MLVNFRSTYIFYLKRTYRTSRQTIMNELILIERMKKSWKEYFIQRDKKYLWVFVELRNIARCSYKTHLPVLCSTISVSICLDMAKYIIKLSWWIFFLFYSLLIILYTIKNQTKSKRIPCHFLTVLGNTKHQI